MRATRSRCREDIMPCRTALTRERLEKAFPRRQDMRQIREPARGTSPLGFPAGQLWLLLRFAHCQMRGSVVVRKG
jgi:hypothetical protein